MRTGVGDDEIAAPGHIFKKLDNKNAIKPKIGDPLGNFILKAWTPGILVKI
jgi:hypothetical protein